ncbi:A-kinase anchor protein 12b isoform X2 [Lampris incognitus]|uniref:A-kinase anchor protein 12b isoform X2 n=1 Tax=Lampris incognitus TaxID=2546036 RepID=UPI0024B522E7|nr:A-kinase anchor protein 12b isoform X2 [Lampris incognitus]
MLGTITLTVGQPDSVSVVQKEEAPETMNAIQGEEPPQVNGEKVEKEFSDANDITAVEEKAAEEKPDEANEVGFKKIFRFVGFKFTLKKDKSEEKDPVKLLTVKDKEGQEVSVIEPTDDAKEKASSAEEEVMIEENVETSAAETDVAEEMEEATTTKVPAEGAEDEDVAKEAKEEVAEKESETSPPSQEVAQSPFRKLFTGGLFSNLRKKASIKKSKEEEEKETVAEEETAEAEETTEAVEEEGEKIEVEQESKEEPQATTPAEEKPELTPELEVAAPAAEASIADEPAPAEEKAEVAAEEEKVPVEVTTETELLSSQEKAKPQGSPLKKLFAGAGLKKLSTKKQKSKKDAEAKITESGEQATEQLQSSTDAAESQKPDSGASSPEDSGEHDIDAVTNQAEPSQEPEGDVPSDGEKKKDGIIPWSSFKKLVTPKKRVKRSSESEDEATGEKPVKSATLSSTESAVFTDKCGEEEEEAKEEKPADEEPKTENTEKLVGSTEEPKKKMDTSVSWEALMCMGGAKKRTRRTSDSDDEETKIEEEATSATGEEGKQDEEEVKTVESPVITAQEDQVEGEVVSSPEPLASPPERESAWDTLKRFVMSKNKPKVEEKTEEKTDQTLSDSEMPKEESSFSFRKLFPGRRKKKVEKQSSADQGSGEEESDTPAVVPLSEYDAEQSEAKEVETATPAAVQTIVSSEDRSPSWIPALVEDVDDKYDPLSDIPEEAENAATPKSAETTIADDEIESQPGLSPAAFGKACSERRLSTAEVKPVVPSPPVETTSVPQEPRSEDAEIIVEGIAEQVSEIPCQTSVVVEDVPVHVATVETEYEPPIEHTESKTKTILKPHLQEEAMAICTGLGTKEIAKTAQEKPVMPTAESVAVISDALCTEVLVEEKTLPSEEATVSMDSVFEAQVNHVEVAELESTPENLEGTCKIQTANESYEPEIEKIALVTTLPEQSEIVQPPSMDENSPKGIAVNLTTPTAEAPVITETVEITLPTIEIKEKELDVEQPASPEENIPVEVEMIVQPVAQETNSTLSETTKSDGVEGTEQDISVVVPSEEVTITQETAVVTAPLSVEPKQVETKEEVETEKAPTSESTGDEPIKVQETKVCTEVEEAVVDASIGAAESEDSADVSEQANDNLQETKEEIEQVNAIEEQSMVIAKSVIQNAVEEVSEDQSEPQKPTSPSSNIPAPVQAVATTEKELDMEMPVVTDAPIATIHETPASPTQESKSPKQLLTAIQVIETTPVELAESLDAPAEEKKSEDELKQDVEVQASEETVATEEKVEVKLDSQRDGELEEVKKKQSKDDRETQEVVQAEKQETADLFEEVKPEPEITMVATPSEEKKEKEKPEIHLPVQVVLQVAQVLEDPKLEEEAVVEFDSNGPVNDVAPTKKNDQEADSPICQKLASDRLPTLLEEPKMQSSTEVATLSQDAQDEVTAAGPATTEKLAVGTCAEVMAQVIEVIEEAVKEIEPISTELTAAS